MTLTIQEGRSWVKSVPHSRESRRAELSIRPRGMGVFRAGPPLPVLLCVADLEGRLVGRSARAFAVLEPPIARRDEWVRTTRRLPAGARMLGRLARGWQFLAPWFPLVVATVVAVPLVLVSRDAAIVAASLVLAGLAVPIGDTIVAVARIVGSLVRSGSTRPTDGDIAGDELRGYHWVITYFHVTDPGDADGLLAEAYERAAALTEEQLPPDVAFGSGLVGIHTGSVTSTAARAAFDRSAEATRIAGTDWFVLGAKERLRGDSRPRPPEVRFRRPRHDAVRPLSGIRLMIAATVLGVVATAQIVATTERSACAPAACGGRPITFLKALPWMLRHVIGQFPEPARPQSQVLGALVLVMVPTMILCVVAALAQRIRYRRARRDLLYDVLYQAATERTVAILVVNDIERDAVVEAFRSRTPGLAPVTVPVGELAAHDLGSVAGARVILAQSEQGTIGAGSMPWTARNLIDRLDPALLILTGICYGLRSREFDGGDQELGDVVVSTELHTVDHRKVTTAPDGSRHEITRGPRPESSRILLSHARVLARGRIPVVHFGRVLSSNTLVNNGAERARYRVLDEEAIAGEMELAGLSAAAASARGEWILVKGISDWGIQKSDAHQALAARHAAEFVADLVAQLHSWPSGG